MSQLPDITAEQADAIFEILKQECGASEFHRGQFPHFVVGRPSLGIAEFRFQGDLGFGGKFYCDSRGHWRVDCYSEDRTPARQAMIDRAMARLAEIPREVEGTR